jgi:hypothetical protein
VCAGKRVKGVAPELGGCNFALLCREIALHMIFACRRRVVVIETALNAHTDIDTDSGRKVNGARIFFRLCDKASGRRLVNFPHLPTKNGVRYPNFLREALTGSHVYGFDGSRYERRPGTLS